MGSNLGKARYGHGCQIFLGVAYQSGKICTELPQKYQMELKYNKFLV
jgi:hypothetical protein